MATAEVGTQRPERGFTLLESAVALSFLSLLFLVAAGVVRGRNDGYRLRGAARVARSELVRARMLAVSRRELVRIRTDDEGNLYLTDRRNRPVASPGFGRLAPFDLDSVRLRPRALRFNARGQAGPGSVYLYGRDRGVRLVVNFVGRIRREEFTLR